MLEKLQGFRVDIIALSITALAALREMCAALTIIDVSDICIDDIFFYLYGSSKAPELAPAYVIWLDMLEKSAGTFNALFVHQSVMFVLFPFAFYALLRFQQQSPFVATTITLLLLPSLVIRTSGGCQPLVSAFAIVIGLIWIIGVEQLRRQWKLNVWLLHTSGFLLLMYIRPEYLLSFALFAVLTIVTFRRTLTAPNIILAIGLVAISSLVITRVGLLIGKGRLDAAFAQHFGINAMMFNRYGPLGNANPWSDFPTFVKISFGEATTFWAAVAANPHAVAAHIAMNVVRFPIVLARTLYLTNPAGFWFFSAVTGIGLSIAMVHAKAMMAGTSVSSTQPWYRRLLAVFANRLTIDRVWIISSIGYLLPFPLTMIIVYPRIHYLGIALVWALLALFGGIRWRQPPQQSERPSIPWLWLLVYIGLVLILYPHPADHYVYPDGSRPGVRMIQAIQALAVSPSHIGSLEGGDYHLGRMLGVQLLDNLHSPQTQKLLPQLRVLIIPRSSTEPVDSTRFRLTSIEHPALQVFVDRNLCSPALCLP